MQQPNILYIFTDQQSASAMSCAGNTDLQTPAMDRLAREGVRFENAYCAFPLCGPSRASMFSGQWPHQCNARFNEHSMNEAARAAGLGNTLAAAGYDCGYGGKWHIPWASPMEEGHGFEYINAFDDFRLAEDSIRFMERERDKPFFLVASFDNPHGICEHIADRPLPWGPVPKPRSIAECPALPPNHPPSAYEPDAIRHGRRDNTPDEWRLHRWNYYRIVEKVDADIGKILDAVDRLGLTENTLVVFSSDHGEMAGAHGRVQKLVFYEESACVPFILRLPGVIDADMVDTRLVNAGIDLMPTLCDFAGAPLPRPLPGHSLEPVLTGGDASWPDEVISTTTATRGGVQGRMVRTARYKYVAYEQGRNREQLFDLDTDPGEMVNLAASARHSAVMQEHRGRLRVWCAAVDDDFGYHYTHPRVRHIVPGDEYPSDSGGLRDDMAAPHPPVHDGRGGPAQF